MKFRLSTLLLLFAIAALTIGWMADRYTLNTRNQNLKSRMSLFNQDWSGIDKAGFQWAFIALGEGEMALEIAKFMQKNGGDLDVQTQKRLVDSVVGIWRSKDEVENFFGDDLPATVVAGRLIAILDCDSSESFFMLSDKIFGKKIDVLGVPDSPVRGQTEKDEGALIQFIDESLMESRR